MVENLRGVVCIEKYSLPSSVTIWPFSPIRRDMKIHRDGSHAWRKRARVLFHPNATNWQYNPWTTRSRDNRSIVHDRGIQNKIDKAQAAKKAFTFHEFSKTNRKDSYLFLFLLLDKLQGYGRLINIKLMTRILHIPTPKNTWPLCLRLTFRLADLGSFKTLQSKQDKRRSQRKI